MKLLPICLLLLFNTVQAKPACFEDWFCITVDELNHTLSAQIQLQKTLPVVVTVDSRALTPATVTLSLTDTQLQTLGTISSSRSFWRTMHVTWTGGKLNATHDKNVLYRYPVSNGDHRIVQGFNGQYSHQGASQYAIDFAVPIGTQVYAARAGTVIDLEESFNRGGPSKKFAKYANYVVILHDDGTTGEYYHLKKRGVLVKRGQQIKRGQLIALSGNTGFSSLPHLHFGVYKALPQGKYQSIKFNFENATTQ